MKKMLAFKKQASHCKLRPVVSLLILVSTCLASLGHALPSGVAGIRPQSLRPERAISSSSISSGNNIVIDSLEIVDGQGASQESERNHYEQAESLQAAAAAKKPEPRSQNEGEQFDKDQQQQQQLAVIQVEPTIIDHRPSGELQLQQQEYLPTTSTQSPLTTTTTPPASTTTVTSQKQERSNQGQQQQQPSFAASGQGASWFQQQPQQTYLQIQQPQMTASSQQVQVAIQPQQQHYPNSVNSIISEHNNQQQVAGAGQQQQQAQAQPQQQAQLVSLNSNGQPTSVLLVASPNGGQPATANGPRRISLSGWLRQISSMLANIFNRREHGTLMAGAGGPWIQLGPNAPHWLSQAQNLLQNQQQQGQQLLSAASASTRYYVQAPAASVQALLPVVQSQPQQPQQQAGVVASQQQQQQQQAQQQASGQYASGDLQMSGSAPAGSYVNVAYQQQPATGASSSAVKSQQVSSSTWPSALRASARTQISAPAVASSTSQPGSSGGGHSILNGPATLAAVSSQASQNLPLAHYM